MSGIVNYAIITHESSHAPMQVFVMELSPLLTIVLIIPGALAYSKVFDVIADYVELQYYINTLANAKHIPGQYEI